MCCCQDSKTELRAANYGTTTTSQIEWWFVDDPERGLKELGLDSWPVDEHLRSSPDELLRGRMRSPRPLSDFDEGHAAVNEQLLQFNEPPLMVIELAMARMYTGPM